MQALGWTLIIVIGATGIALPQPYSSKESCVDAAKAASTPIPDGKFTCVPTESPMALMGLMLEPAPTTRGE